jgi:heme/copper-type cytochrome/quinol oxidase subunit 2
MMKRFTTYVLTILLWATFIFAPNLADAQTHKKEQVTYIVTGQARVWEASYSYRVKAGKKEIVKGYGTASTGAPEWGDFKEEITVNKQKNLTLELFEVSQENGKDINKLIIKLDKAKGKTYKNKAFRDVKVSLQP